ncbi:hypothetical protein Bbelb_255010 [Branchiostoma belcheri]|nr:hypothetical protein Bbelb_255010 [Branchiostoma belcheri]
MTTETLEEDFEVRELKKRRVLGSGVLKKANTHTSPSSDPPPATIQRASFHVSVGICGDGSCYWLLVDKENHKRRIKCKTNGDELSFTSSSDHRSVHQMFSLLLSCGLPLSQRGNHTLPLKTRPSSSSGPTGPSPRVDCCQMAGVLSDVPSQQPRATGKKQRHCYVDEGIGTTISNGQLSSVATITENSDHIQIKQRVSALLQLPAVCRDALVKVPQIKRRKALRGGGGPVYMLEKCVVQVVHASNDAQHIKTTHV